MESSEVVREEEHPFAKKRWIIAVSLVILTILGLFTAFSQEAYPFLYEIF